MTEYGLTNAGFVRKRLTTLLSEMRAGVGAAVGGTIGYILNGVTSVYSERLDTLWQQAELIAAGFNPDDAGGVMLEHGAAWTYQYRDLGSATQGVATFTGPEGTAIALGLEVRASTLDERFRTKSDATIPASGSIDVAIECVIVGPTVVEAGEVDEIVDSLPGVTVTNTSKLTTGTNEQTDEEFRATRRLNTSASGGSSPSALSQKLGDLGFIEQVRVFDNKTGTTNALGLPSGAIQAVMYPSTDDADELASIAAVMDRRNGAGGYLYGDETYNGVDADGYDQTYFWSWATVTDLYIDIVRTKDTDYPADGDDQSAAALSAYSDDFLIGQVAKQHVLECELLNAVTGFSTLEIRLSRSNPPTENDTSNITPTAVEIFQIQAANVRVIDP